MAIEQTRHRGFRNLQKASVHWGEGINLIQGPNGAGKTNMLEALHILTGWGTFGAMPISQTVTWDGGDGASLAAQTEGPAQHVIEAHLRARASLKLDGKICRWVDLRSAVQSLSFLPVHMALIEGSPSVRRRFLDVLCALVYPLYALKLVEYKKIVRNRRYLLSLGKSPAVTDLAMADLAAWVWKCRHSVAQALKDNLSRWSDLSCGPLELELIRGGAGLAEEPREDFLSSLRHMAQRERCARSPLVGPHRDDLRLACRGRAAAEAFSRGQRRRAALALIMAAASTVERVYGAAPLLLLDEVTSELDVAGREVLMECLAASRWQIFAATAEAAPPFEGALWRMEQGRLERIG